MGAPTKFKPLFFIKEEIDVLQASLLIDMK